jgi:hypothetical protein
MAVHGLSFAEAQMVTNGELQRAYDDRKKLRRSRFTVVETSSSGTSRQLLSLVTGLDGLQDGSLVESKPRASHE